MEGKEQQNGGEEIKTRNEETEGTRTTTTTTRMFRKSLYKTNSVSVSIRTMFVRSEMSGTFLFLFLSLQIFTLQSINTVHTRERSANLDAYPNTRPKDEDVLESRILPYGSLYVLNS